MDGYTLPREAFALLEEAFGDRDKAETFARAMEAAITAIDVRAAELITARKEHLKIEVKDELRDELITRELFEQEVGRLEREIMLTREMFEQETGRLEREIGLTREMFEQETRLTRELLEQETRLTRELLEQETGRLGREIGLTREMFERETTLTRELFDERFNTIDERFKVIDERFNGLNFKLNIFIGIALLALTLANPTFVALIERLFRSIIP